MIDDDADIFGLLNYC